MGQEGVRAAQNGAFGYDTAARKQPFRLPPPARRTPEEIYKMSGQEEEDEANTGRIMGTLTVYCAHEDIECTDFRIIIVPLWGENKSTTGQDHT